MRTAELVLVYVLNPRAGGTIDVDSDLIARDLDVISSSHRIDED